ncbi:hypothetical protein BX666DRAFT_1934166 [Dichotomocladium elegans]|nr:hypothetical protein BX666DRAFT_1934166 [Dichotomocladium elegans]
MRKDGFLQGTFLLLLFPLFCFPFLSLMFLLYSTFRAAKDTRQNFAWSTFWTDLTAWLSRNRSGNPVTAAAAAASSNSTAAAAALMASSEPAHQARLLLLSPASDFQRTS